jgi:Flp pilus assembly protein TadD
MPRHKPAKKKAAPLPLPLWQFILVALVLAAASLAAYHDLGNDKFISIDDPLYVADNPHVQKGLSWEGAVWAFTSLDATNWHPLTWLSHMLDVEVFGARVGAYHLVNLGLHVASAILLLAFLAYTTRRLWLAAVVAGLFALHPLHVESVAWLSERKDVLSTFFWMAAMLSYAFYTRKPTWRRYAAVIALFGMGLMAKPMLVTLPLALLLLDYWPLERFQPGSLSLKRLIMEKLPLFALAAASCAVTLIAQRPAASSMQSITLGARLANALSSYVIYLRQMLWPADLAILYPYPPAPSYAAAAATLVLLAAITLAAIRWGRSGRYILVGWLWYLVTLVPVIGVVQVGIQAHADRYTYIPLIGLFMAAVFAIGEAVERRPSVRRAVIVTAATALVALGVITSRQAGYWHNTMMLYMRASAANDAAAQPYLGMLFASMSDERMIAELQDAIATRPKWAQAHAHLGALLGKTGRADAGMAECEKALELKPDLALGHRTMGMLLAAKRDYSGAAREYGKSLAIQPDSTTWNNLADAQTRLGQLDVAETSLRQAIAMSPGIAVSHANLAVVLVQLGRREEAIAELHKSLALDPGNAAAKAFLSKLESSAH